MSKKNKNKPKKINAKKEKYLKFRKEKPTNPNFTAPENTPEYQKQNQDNDRSLDRFLRFNRNAPVREIVERRSKSKR